MSRVLVDSSVWIEMLRNGESAAARRLGRLLQDGLVCTSGLIQAEILSGARSDREFEGLRADFSALTFLPDPPDLWDTVAVARYRLARKGFEASIADLVVAASACHHRKTLFTLDHAFERIKGVIRIDTLP
ncbi:MAG: PIN domain-containing protein [Elusimicrobia bacterium]|nr:PIN domain-containing protein [Elusimicrobiota bacterium]